MDPFVQPTNPIIDSLQAWKLQKELDMGMYCRRFISLLQTQYPPPELYVPDGQSSGWAVVTGAISQHGKNTVNNMTANCHNLLPYLLAYKKKWL